MGGTKKVVAHGLWFIPCSFFPWVWSYVSELERVLCCRLLCVCLRSAGWTPASESWCCWKHGARGGPSAGGNAGPAQVVVPHNPPWYVNIIGFYLRRSSIELNRPRSDGLLFLTFPFFFFLWCFASENLNESLKAEALWCGWIRRLLCSEREAVVCCVGGGGGGVLGHFLLGSCIAMFPEAIFFFSDTDHIEPFVSGRFDVYTEWFLLSISLCRFKGAFKRVQK